MREFIAGEVPENLKQIVEGALMAAAEALPLERILSLFEDHERPTKTQILEVLSGIQEQGGERGYQLVEVASGWRYQVDPELAPWVNRLWEEKPQKYSRALLETLALIAYRQPLTRSDIEEVRGVAVSSHIIKTLAERDWIKVVGHRDVPGRPSLYATTKQFLDYFGLKSLEELPTLGELKDIDSLNERLQLEDVESSAESSTDELSAEASENPEQAGPESSAAAKADASADVSANDSEPSVPEQITSGEASEQEHPIESNGDTDAQKLPSESSQNLDDAQAVEPGSAAEHDEPDQSSKIE